MIETDELRARRALANVVELWRTEILSPHRDYLAPSLAELLGAFEVAVRADETARRRAITPDVDNTT